MCQWKIRSRFNRSENRQIRKVASLAAQALSVPAIIFDRICHFRCYLIVDYERRGFEFVVGEEQYEVPNLPR
jgi:hypothetical protein